MIQRITHILEGFGCWTLSPTVLSKYKLVTAKYVNHFFSRLTALMNFQRESGKHFWRRSASQGLVPRYRVWSSSSLQCSGELQFCKPSCQERDISRERQARCSLQFRRRSKDEDQPRSDYSQQTTDLRCPSASSPIYSENQTWIEQFVKNWQLPEHQDMSQWSNRSTTSSCPQCSCISARKEWNIRTIFKKTKDLQSRQQHPGWRQRPHRPWRPRSCCCRRCRAPWPGTCRWPWTGSSAGPGTPGTAPGPRGRWASGQSRAWHQSMAWSTCCLSSWKMKQLRRHFPATLLFLRKSAVSKKDPGGLPLHPEVKVGELDVWHFNRKVVNLSWRLNSD